MQICQWRNNSEGYAAYLKRYEGHKTTLSLYAAPTNVSV